MSKGCKATIPVAGAQVQKLKAALKADHNILMGESMPEPTNTADRSCGNHNFKTTNLSSRYNLRSKRLLDSSPNLQTHFPRIVSFSSFGSIGRGTKAMKSTTPPPMKRRHIEAESKVPLSSGVVEHLGPVCSVPMVPSFDGHRVKPSLKTTGTQTSPSHTAAFPDRIDGLNFFERRQSKGRLIKSLKNKFTNLRRSLNIDRESVNRSGEYESLIDDMDENFDEQRSVVEEEASITVRLLEKCSADTFIVQLRRQCPTQQIGIFFNMDSIGLYISRLAKEKHIKAVKEYLRVNDRIVSLQGVPSYHLDADAIREVIRGCHIITIKVVRPSRG